MNPAIVRLCAWAGLHRRQATPRRTPASSGLAYEEIRFPTVHPDGVRLSGWLIPAPDPRGLVILCHGYGSTRSFMLCKAILLQRHNYTTLLFDFRARGLSEGQFCTLGYRETEDVLGAIRYVLSRQDVACLPLALLGESMGGAAVIQAAARETHARAVIAEAAFASLDQAILHRFRMFLGRPGARLAGSCMALGETDFGLPIHKVAPIAAIPHIAPRPVFLLTDGLDAVCPRSESDRLYAAAQEPKQRWIVPAALHSYAFQAARAEYERRITDFLNAALS
ncbi:MAG TPA: alpha/beta hydrolase [Chthonomonadaceae bacterium]|nr:alpha/beta hydrolase [Chthonomonadaceae bacterium]